MAFLEWFKKHKNTKKTQKYNKGLEKSNLSFSKNIKKLSTKYKEYNNSYLEDLENILIASDMGIENVVNITSQLEKKAKSNKDFNYLNNYLIELIINIYTKGNSSSKLNLKKNNLNVIMMVGVNGTGKTTTTAKIANILKAENYKILLIAADTFRAGATEQLVEWSKKLAVDVFTSSKPRQDPASVVYQGLDKAKAEEYNLVIIDTAGRLQNKVNLMNELQKIHSIIKRKVHHAPQETLLVLDAMTGQNGLDQAKVFYDSTKVSGVVLTKMDGSAKGGISFAIKSKLNIPIKFIGFGEKLEDLQEFDINEYVYGLAKDLFEKEEK